MDPAQSTDGTATCFNLLRRLFPGLAGQKDFPYLAFPLPFGEHVAAYATPPLLPPDVFAAAAHLLDLSGAYHHVLPELAANAGERPRSGRLVLVSQRDIRRARAVAAAWRAFHPDIRSERWQGRDAPGRASKFGPLRPGFQQWLACEGRALRYLFVWWWRVFHRAGASPVFQIIDSREKPPPWWKSALMLLTAADEASVGIGYQIHVASAAPGARDDTPWVAKMIESQMVDTFRRAGAEIVDRTGAAERFGGIGTISLADQDMVSVLPKARTPSVGCTLRSLSHHLALLPPRGVARASWTPYLFHSPPPDEQHLNLLLIPFPYAVSAEAFRPRACSEGPGMRWGFFGVHQTWLDGIEGEDFVGHLLAFIQALATEARKECDHIHGVVFPELALNQHIYGSLSERLPKILPDVELLVAGQSGGAGGRAGNFVAVTVYQQAEGDGAGRQGPRRYGLMTRREKHHRWRLDRGQILDYGLEGMLSPSQGWWEDIDLLSRRVDFSVFRAHSVFSAMICEDLARVDPCQELLRSIGPSLIFALLMDAPQLRARWPGRYATVLAEDPGTAVLTLTSKALMTRQHRLGLRRSEGPHDRVIALWRDDSGLYEEIDCPDDAQAVRLTLSGQPSVDITLDGRDDRTAVSWRYGGRRPVRLRNAAREHGRIVGHAEASNRRAKP